MLLTYNIIDARLEPYRRFMVNEFIPTLQSLGLTNHGVWDTAWGNYPTRLLVFVSENSSAMERATKSDVFNDMEEKLKSYVTDYLRRVVEFDPGFQF